MSKINKRIVNKGTAEEYWRWVLRYQSATTGKQRLETFTKYKDAESRKTIVDSELRERLHVPGSESATINKLCDMFLVQAEQRARTGEITDGRVAKLRSTISLYIKPMLGVRKIKDLTWGEVEKWHSSLLAAGLKPISAKSYVRNLALIEDFARKRGYTKQRVVSDVCKDIRGAKSEPVRSFTTLEKQRLFQAVEMQPEGSFGRPYFTLRLYVYLAAICGMRYSEVCALSLSQVDFDNEVIRIRHSLPVGDKIKGTKSKAGERNYFAPAELLRMLRSYISVFYEDNERQLIFRTRFGNRMGHGNFHTHLWRPLLKRAGLDPKGENDKRLNFHALRHYNASALGESRMASPAVIARLMGHSSFDMTLRTYMHALDDGETFAPELRAVTTALLPPPRQDHDMPL